MVFDSLVTKDDKGAFQPALTESWQVSPDWAYVDLNLRKGVAFHNGDPFSADDVVFSFARAIRDDLRFIWRSEFMSSIDRVEKLNDYKVRIHLKMPYPAIFDRCFEYFPIVPKNYIEKVGDKGFAQKPVGAGPFKVTKFERDVSVEVEAVENHYRQTPYVKHIKYVFVPEASTRLAMLKTGEADMAMLVPAQIPIVQRDKDLRIKWSKHTFLQTLVFFDLSHPEDSPFKDPRVRKAASLAIDRAGIAKALSNGAEEPWGSFLAPYHLGYGPSVKPDPYDPEKAKKLLAEAGYPNGFDTVLVTHPTMMASYEAASQQLSKVGIRCKLVAPEAGTHSKTFVAAKFHGLGYGSGPWWVGRGHPAVALASHTTGAWSHNLATPEINEAMNKLANAVGDENIAKLARALDDLLLKSMRRIPLWSTNVAYALGPKVEDYPGVPGVVYPMNLEYLKIK
ncbi:MAG: ABC transporter substrate-binding protein [Desulfarculaceae bacterium]|jgi:peptide/nickel transport system substrate-binding protein